MLSITAAARRLRTTPRMLRYRESLGLLPAERMPGAHRRYDEDSVRAIAYAIRLEQTYDVSPSALVFALRALTEPGVHADVQRLGELTGRTERSTLAALDFEQEKARRLLRSRNPIPSRG